MPTVLLILNLKNCIDQIKQFFNNQVSISISKYFILHENAYEMGLCDKRSVVCSRICLVFRKPIHIYTGKKRFGQQF